MKTKTKLTVAVASVLSVAALAGTGYAGWVLSHNVEKSASGNMETYGVADKTVTLSDITFHDNKNSIIWGKAAKEESVKGTWFGYTSDVENEFFTPVLHFTITNTDATDEATPVFEKATITVKDTGTGDYAKCLQENLIKGPKAGIATKIQVPTGTNVKNVFTYDMKLVDENGGAFFGWGSYFKGSDGNPTNPINFYNDKKANDNTDGTTETTTGEEKKTPWYEDAKAKMEMIQKLSGVQFDIRLVVNHAALSENK